jgi:hypothetical protein
VEGRPVNYHPCSYDSSRRVNLNEMYSNKNETYNSDNVSHSSKIVLNPKDSSVVSNKTVLGDSTNNSEAARQVKDIYTKPLPEGQNIYASYPKRTL